VQRVRGEGQGGKGPPGRELQGTRLERKAMYNICLWKNVEATESKPPHSSNGKNGVTWEGGGDKPATRPAGSKGNR